MATSVGDLSVNVSANIASLYTGMQQAADVVGRTAQKMSDQFAAFNRSISTAGAALGALGVGLSVAGFVGAIKSVIDYADKLNDLSKQTGIAVETLGGLGYAAKTAGVDLDSVASGTVKLSRAMADAAGGNQQLSKLFADMGVGIKDATGSLVPLEKVLGDVATKFASYQDGPAKAALATQLFGKAGAALIPLLNEGGEKLQAMVREYQEYAGVTTETAQRADAFNDTLEKIKLIQGALFREIASALLPTLQAIANVFLDAKNKGDGFSTTAQVITTVVKALGVAAVGVVAAFQAVGKSIGAVAAAFALAITGDFNGALAALKIGFADVADTVGESMKRAATIWNASAATIPVETAKAFSKTDAPIKNTGKVVKELGDSLDKLFAPLNKLFESLGKEAAALDANLDSLRKYGVETKETAAAITEFEVTQGKAAQAIAALNLVLPGAGDLLANYAIAQAQSNDAKKIAIELEKQYQDAVRRSAQALGEGLDAINREIDAERDRALSIGLTRAEYVDLRIAQEESALASLRVMDGAELEVKAAELRIAKLKELRGLTANTDFIAEQTRGWTELFRDVADRGAQFIEDFVEHGSSAFKNLWNDFKSFALRTLAQIAAQKVVVALAGSFGLGNVAQNALGGSQSGFLGNLLGGGGNLLGEAPFVNGAGPLAQGSGVVGFLADKGLPTIASAVSTIGQFLPVLGLAIPLLGSLFDKKPSPVKGQFGISAGTGGFEDNAFTSSAFGNLGFLDSATQQFSGQAAQAFNKIVGGALDAFESRFSPEQSDRLASILQNTTFASAEGTFTTEEFLQKYGGDVLQQVVSAAFDVLDPALGSVVRNFHGTADEIAKFGNTLLSIHDATDKFSEDFKAGITAALQGATQETADKVLAFVNVVSTFGDSLAGIGTSLQSLDPSTITEFVDALGGAQAFFDSFSFLSQNFLTSAERTAQAAQQLTADFEALGIAVPQTHQAFLDLIKSALAVGNTDLAASLQKLAPLFVAVKGTADQAAEAVAKLADSAGDAAEAIKQAAAEITVSTGQIVEAGKSAAAKLLDSIAELADASTGDFGDKLSIQIGLILDALDKAGAIQNIDGSFRLLGGSQADKIYVTELSKSYVKFAGELARFTILSAQFDAARAEQLVGLEEWYEAQKKLFADNGAALAALDTIFQQKWDAIVNGASQAAEALDDFIKTIQGLANATQGNAGQQAGIELALSSARLKTLQEQFAQALPGSALATALAADIKKLEAYNAGLATQIAHFAIYSAQFGKDIANQLVELENWYADQQAAFAGNTDALAILGDIFNEKWQAIINGVADGVDQLSKLKVDIAEYLKGLTVSEISPLSPEQKLAEARSSLDSEIALAKTGDLKALGDVTKYLDTFLALDRDFNKSNDQFATDFEFYRNQLADIAGVQPNGQPLDSATLLAQALPVNGKLASSDDLKAVRDLLERLITELADANTADSLAEREALQEAADKIAAAAGASELK